LDSDAEKPQNFKPERPRKREKTRSQVLTTRFVQWLRWVLATQKESKSRFFLWNKTKYYNRLYGDRLSQNMPHQNLVEGRVSTPIPLFSLIVQLSKRAFPKWAFWMSTSPSWLHRNPLGSKQNFVRVEASYARPGPSREDAPCVEAIGGLQHKRRTLNTWLSSGASVRIFTCYAAAGPYRSSWAKQVRKTNWVRILFLAGDKEWLESRSSSRVSNQDSCLFRFQKVQLHWATLRVFYAHSL